MDSYAEVPERTETGLSGALLAGGVILVVVLILGAGVDLISELRWFESLGLSSVFVTSVVARGALFLFGAALFLALFAANAVAARRLAYGLDIRSTRRSSAGTWEELLNQIGAQVARRGDYSRLVGIGILLGGVVLALLMGLLAAGNWLTLLQFLNRHPFGSVDPIFGQDIAFFVFTMPLLRATEGWLFMALILLVISASAVYAMVLTYELAVNIGRVPIRLSRGVKAHLMILAAAAFVLIASNHLLDMLDLVRSVRGDKVVGAGYTDVHAQIPAQYLLTLIALSAAVLCLLSIRSRGFRLAIIGVAVWGVALLAAGWLFPTILQGIDVSPNELDRERPYIATGIQYTREAYGLDRIDERELAFEDTVPASVIESEQTTVENIRLWDTRPLLDTLRQIQAIRLYYDFNDVDVDRYTVDGQYRQFMVSARELVTDKLPAQAQGWVSRQLQYTHGYGITMARVNVISQEGLPELTVRDVPPIGPLPVTRPEIYFGEKTDHYVVTRTSTLEFDYPRGDEGVFTRGSSDAGIPVGTFWDRLLFALKLQDPNFLLNSALQSDSRLLFRRNVADRVRTIAPFLRLDSDPYVVLADGQVYWIQDAYTATDRYPYSRPYAPNEALPRQRVNYIRNSVKIVTSAYDGSIHLYVVDPSDPLIQTYAQAFPTMFTPIDQAPSSIRAHFRYPEDLFRLQSRVYLRYHVQDPRVFYLSEDEWSVPKELYDSSQTDIEPYYVIMKLPGESRAEFVLMRPFGPVNRQNMVAWLAARSDEPNYGRMVSYKYPKDKLIFGPLQIENRVDQDPAISSQFSLWNQAGSKVLRGNMLVIPLGQSNLYVEPVYLQATATSNSGNGLPELKRVVVANGNRVAMEATLAEAIARVVGTSAPAAPATPAPTNPAGPPGSVSQLAAEAQARYNRAQEALRAGDFGRYGEEIRALEQILNELVRASQAQP